MNVLLLTAAAIIVSVVYWKNIDVFLILFSSFIIRIRMLFILSENIQ
jgi:hypothetical protein